MIFLNKGIKTSNYFLPPFQLNYGEIAIIRFKNDLKSSIFEKELMGLLSKNTNHKNIISNHTFSIADYKKFSLIAKLFYKDTVKNYLKKNADLESPFASKIYEIDYIQPDTLLNRLPGNPRKQLYLYCTLSKTKYLIFNLHGLDNQGRMEIFQMVKKYIKELKGAAIMLDCFKGLEHLCDVNIELQYYQGDT